MIAHWWAQRQAREQRLLLVGAAILAVILLWTWVWQPLHQRRDALLTDAAGLEADLEFMVEAAADVQAARSRRPPSAIRSGESLLGFIDRSARDRGLGVALRRAEPVGDDAVRLWLDNANFDMLVMWLEKLSRDQGIELSEVAISRGDHIGVINGRLTLVQR